MNLRQYWLLQAVCSLIAITATTYATTATPTETQRGGSGGQQPEVTKPPVRRGSLKYGDVFKDTAVPKAPVNVATRPMRGNATHARQSKRQRNEAAAAYNVDQSAESKSKARKPAVASGERHLARTKGNRSQEAFTEVIQRSTASKERNSLSRSKETNSRELNVSKEPNSGDSNVSSRSKEVISTERNSQSKSAESKEFEVPLASNTSSDEHFPGDYLQQPSEKNEQIFRYAKDNSRELRQPQFLLPNAGDSHSTFRRNTGVAIQNQLELQQYDIPIVQKTHKPVTPARSQQASSHAPLEYPAPQRSSQQNAVPPPQPQPLQPQSKTSPLPARPSGLHTTSRRPTSTSTSTSTSRNTSHNSGGSNSNSRRNSAEIAGNSSRGNHRSQPHSNLNAASSVEVGARPSVSATNVAHQRPPHSRKPSPSTSAIATTTTTPRPFFSLPNQYNIFSSEFWQFLNPAARTTSPPPIYAPMIRTTTTTTTTTTTKRPPKKYKPPMTSDERSNVPKPKSTYALKALDAPENNELSPPVRKDDGPFRIALPTFNVLNSQRQRQGNDKEKRNTDIEDSREAEDLRAKFNCPRESEVRFQLFPKICKIDEDCKTWNRGEICCEIFGASSCVSGIPKPLEETSHSPILGLIPRKCPSRPLAELWWEVKECETDMDCWPRVCCPDGRKRYCRTSQPELNTIPVPVKRSFNYLTEYLECTPPPPRIFDLHPKTCNSTLDCFPNVCCQEAGLRHCRPPKKSVLTMLATVFNVDLVKRLTQNIVIK